MRFEFDSHKSESNHRKHGVDFHEIQSLWNGARVEIKANVVGEMRYAVFGIFQGKNFTVIISYRGAIIRIISARLSTEKEIEIYEQYKK